MGVKITKDGRGQLAKALKALTSKDVLVGIPDGVQRVTGPLTNSEIGFIQEKGSVAKRIPARPFLLPGFNKAKARILPVLQSGGEQVLEGDLAAAGIAMNAAGLLARNAVVLELTTGPHAPLAPATIAARLRAGRRSTKPLIDTGSLRKSVTFVVQSK